jgi:DNA-directed RNA polymerase subunit N
MMIPIRCWSCGKPVSHLWETFLQRLEKEGPESRKKILDELGLERYCCRALFLGHVDLIDTTARFKKF